MREDITQQQQESKKIAKWKHLYEDTYRCTNCQEMTNVAEDKNYMPKYRYCPYCSAEIEGVI